MRRKVIGAFRFVIGGLVAFPAVAWPDYPERPVKMVSTNPAGGDPLMRVVADMLEKRWKQPVLVENRPGAGGLIALEYAAKAEPDGYTVLGNGSTSHFIHHLFNTNLRVDAQKDLAVVATYSRSVTMLQASADTAKSYAEFVAAARANPDKFAYASLGRTAMLLYMERFKSLAGLKVREIPYKGINEITTALLRNEIQLASLPGPFVRAHIESGRIKPLLVVNATRLPDFPDVPTAAEIGLPEYQTFTWNCIMVPAKTSAEIQRKIHATMRDIVASADFRDTLYRAGGSVPFFLEPSEIQPFVNKTIADWTAMARANNIHPE